MGIQMTIQQNRLRLLPKKPNQKREVLNLEDMMVVIFYLPLTIYFEQQQSTNKIGIRMQNKVVLNDKLRLQSCRAKCF